jgi:hypothetical protein
MHNHPLGPKVKQSFDQARAARSIWDANLQDLRQLVRADTKDFNRSGTPGERRYDNIFDGTAVDACEEFASGVHAYLSSPTERWFELGIAAIKKQDLKNDEAATAWLELVSEIIYDVFSDVRANFNTTLHETYLDLGAFGTGVVGIEWNKEDQHIIFRNDSLSEFFFEEDSKGKITRLWQYFEMTGDQICQEFMKDGYLDGSDLWKDCCIPSNANTKYKLIKRVCPRHNQKDQLMPAINKPFESIIISEKFLDVCRISGYDSFPHAVSRWVKIGGEVYGRSPAMKCMPDIMALQTMERTLLKAGQKAVDPPMIFPDDGFLEPLSTAPGSIMFKEVGAEKAEALDFKGNLNFGVEQCEQKRNYIRKCFHSEWFKRFKKTREQSATEVLDDRDEMLRMLAPMLGRQQNELLGPIIQRVYSLLHTHGLIPPAPESLQKQRLVILYISPAARAQQGVKADRMSRFMQDLTPLAQIDPSVMDAVKPDEMVRVYADARGVPRVILRTIQEVQQMREAKQQQQQMAQMAQTAEPASKALLNVAQATAASGGGNPGGPV